jgi:hypothetical protein
MWLIMLLSCIIQLTQNFVFCNLYICLKIFQIWQFANFFIPPLLQEWIIPFLFLLLKKIYQLLHDFNLSEAWMHIYYLEHLTCNRNIMKNTVSEHINTFKWFVTLLICYPNILMYLVDQHFYFTANWRLICKFFFRIYMKYRWCRSKTAGFKYENSGSNLGIHVIF